MARSTLAIAGGKSQQFTILNIDTIFNFYKPKPPLSKFVDNFWLYEGYEPEHKTERILPTGTLELVINLRQNELRIYDAERPENCSRLSGAIFSGASGRGFSPDTAEAALIIGVHFKPGGAFPFLGLPAGDLSDTHVDLETLWGRSAVELRERLCGASTPVERFCLLEEALMAHLFRPLEHHYAVPMALEAFAHTDARATVRDVARRIGLSQRRFIQVFTAEVGLSPKRFCRVQRFHRALALARQNTAPDWAQLAVDGGYCDQSHLIRDFLAFSGFSPTDYLRQQHALRQRGVHLKRNHLP